MYHLSMFQMSIIVMTTTFFTALCYKVISGIYNPYKENYYTLMREHSKLIVSLKKNPNDADMVELERIIEKLRKIDCSIASYPRPLGGNYTNDLGMMMDAMVAYKACKNNLNAVGNGRPDLAFITNAKTKTATEFASHIKSLRPDQAEAYYRAESYVPELVEIAEMYYDSLVDDGKEKTIQYAVLNQTLKRIANGKAK